MARFILDVLDANISEVLGIVEESPLVGYVARIVLIDESNNNQLLPNESENALSDVQIANYNKELAKMYR